MFLGVDGGGTKTAFALIDRQGQVLARNEQSSAYYLEVGMEGAADVLARGCAGLFATAGVTASDVAFAFFGLPAYGEDRVVQAQLDALPRAVLGHARYLCDNDMVCSWAGSLACADGISVIAGTGSMAYGRIGGQGARAGGWGELFSDEGSAYWSARAGFALFSRMSDGRAPRGPLHGLMRTRLSLQDDLDLCQVVYGELKGERSKVAALSRLVSEAAALGDAQAVAILESAALEVAALVDAVRDQLGVDPGTEVTVSYSGGLFGEDGPLRAPFARVLAASSAGAYRLMAPRLPPVLGAAVYAAHQVGIPLNPAALDRLAGTQ
jgi:N-acetylglucosamine kinase-like BadF-type ATPase